MRELPTSSGHETSEYRTTIKAASVLDDDFHDIYGLADAYHVPARVCLMGAL